jgi:hypothetical protein
VVGKNFCYSQIRQDEKNQHFVFIVNYLIYFSNLSLFCHAALRLITRASSHSHYPNYGRQRNAKETALRPGLSPTAQQAITQNLY